MSVNCPVGELSRFHLHNLFSEFSNRLDKLFSFVYQPINRYFDESFQPLTYPISKISVALFLPINMRGVIQLCHLPILNQVANSLEPDQAGQNVWHDLDPKCFAVMIILKVFYGLYFAKKKINRQTKTAKITQHAKSSKNIVLTIRDIAKGV